MPLSGQQNEILESVTVNVLHRSLSNPYFPAVHILVATNTLLVSLSQFESIHNLNTITTSTKVLATASYDALDEFSPASQIDAPYSTHIFSHWLEAHNIW